MTNTVQIKLTEYFYDKETADERFAGKNEIPDIPLASLITPDADTENGTIGESDNYARADHTHPQSNIYAEAEHTHTGMLTNNDIENNLTSTNTNKALSANQGKELKTLVDGKANNEDLSLVAISGRYTDLTDKPTIPSATASTPKADGIGFAGSSGEYARANHVHPLSDLYAKDNHNHDGVYQPVGNYLTSHQDISGKANSSDLADIATSGSYTDLDGVTTEELEITYDDNGTYVTETITFLIIDDS